MLAAACVALDATCTAVSICRSWPKGRALTQAIWEENVRTRLLEIWPASRNSGSNPNPQRESLTPRTHMTRLSESESSTANLRTTNLEF